MINLWSINDYLMHKTARNKPETIIVVIIIIDNSEWVDEWAEGSMLGIRRGFNSRTTRSLCFFLIRPVPLTPPLLTPSSRSLYLPLPAHFSHYYYHHHRGRPIIFRRPIWKIAHYSKEKPGRIGVNTTQTNICQCYKSMRLLLTWTNSFISSSCCKPYFIFFLDFFFFINL